LSHLQTKQLKEFHLFSGDIKIQSNLKLFIATLNAHSFNLCKEDEEFCKALKKSDILLPDGISIVLATRFLQSNKIKKIAGADLFMYEMKELESEGGTCFFLGSTNETLGKIKDKAKQEFPHVKIHSYSPPFKENFTEEEDNTIISAINNSNARVLFIGMTAPKQEKWCAANFEKLNVKHACCIGAVFDFYAGSIKRAPNWMIQLGLEWFYRLIKEPRRMWKRYLIGNLRFVWYILLEKWNTKEPI
jgi:N-acetylglucosaminyldiphosphoundecaprenol N-acetyl-beta-D-mannosaminyltransferase